MKFNDLNLKDWKNIDIDVNSLWLIDKRKNSGKHQNIYHGNFIPQIPNQLIRRYTKEKETVFDVFLGSGTTLFEAELLNRNIIGSDINREIISYVKSKRENNFSSFIDVCDVTNSNEVDNFIKQAFKQLNIDSVEFIIMHPPYLNIIQFTSENRDLSNIKDLKTFIKKFIKVVDNTLKYLKKNRYFALILGDIYKNSEVVPLSFYAMDAIKRNFKTKLKGIIVKNIEGNRGKIKTGGIWRYRALSSDYYIFKHEYIFVFKKEF